MAIDRPVQIAYVGNDETFFDHIYNSGMTFEKGVTTSAPAWLAVRLLKHTEFEDRRPGFLRDKAIKVVNDKPVEQVDEETEQHYLYGQIPLENMTVHQMRVFSMQNFGVMHPMNMLKDDMQNEVRNLVGLRRR